MTRRGSSPPPEPDRSALRLRVLSFKAAGAGGHASDSEETRWADVGAAATNRRRLRRLPSGKSRSGR